MAGDLNHLVLGDLSIRLTGFRCVLLGTLQPFFEKGALGMGLGEISLSRLALFSFPLL